jgi:hypothetical protein
MFPRQTSLFHGTEDDVQAIGRPCASGPGTEETKWDEGRGSTAFS